MANLTKIFGAIMLPIFLSGCLSIGSGPLTNSISVPLSQIKKKHKLPSGFCLDKGASSSTAYQETMVVSNCIAVSKGNNFYFSRRPVDTIVNIAFTRSAVPKDISQQEYLSVIAGNMEFKKFLTASSNKKIVYGQKKLRKTFFHVSFQRISSSDRREFVRKYFFFVNKKLVVMTILSFQKPRKNTYISFERFIKKLSSANF